jgi:hypothetical protein
MTCGLPNKVVYATKFKGSIVKIGREENQKNLLLAYGKN